MITETWMDSPVGALRLVADEISLRGVYFEMHRGQRHPTGERRSGHPILDLTTRELQRYFAGEPVVFTAPLAPLGTPFQRKVWSALQGIPRGGTLSYGELARAIDVPRAARAVGAANGSNPWSIVVPCHRVIASTGDLAGYAGGAARKQWLLHHEQGRATSLCSAA